MESVSFPAIPESQFDISRYRKVPFSELAALGAAFSSLPAAARTITQTQTVGLPGGEKLYRRVVREGVSGVMQQAKDGRGELGNIMRMNEQGKNVIVARAGYLEVNGGLPVTMNTTVPFDPTMMFVAAALMNIEKKLDEIQEMQRDMMAFLEAKEKAKQRGNLNALMEVLNNYKFNWNNENYKKNKHILVQDIKKDAELSIILYQELIARKLEKRTFFHASWDAQKVISSTCSEFQEYKLAVSLFAFAQFLEVMLLENYETGFLKSVGNKIEAYTARYREIYEVCQGQIEEYMKSSLDKRLFMGIGEIGKILGNAVAKVPIANKYQIDETLVGAGNQLGEMTLKSVEQALKPLIALQEINIQPFVDNIHAVDALYNQPMGILIDQENMYCLAC